jgi:hypothetical protein
MTTKLTPGSIRAIKANQTRTLVQLAKIELERARLIVKLANYDKKLAGAK